MTEALNLLSDSSFFKWASLILLLLLIVVAIACSVLIHFFNKLQHRLEEIENQQAPDDTERQQVPDDTGKRQKPEKDKPVTIDRILNSSTFVRWLSLILFVIAGLACWMLIAYLTGNYNQVGLAVVVVLGLGALIMLLYFYWRQETLEALNILEETEPLLQAVVDQKIAEKPDLAPLGPIWKKLSAGRAHHQDILVHITSLQYALARTLIFGSLGGAIVVYFIFNQENRAATHTQDTLFVSLAAVAAYCQITPNVLSLNANLTVHLARYQAFLALLWELYRYITTQKDANGNDQTAASFIQDITRRLIDLPPAPFGIDPSQVGSITTLARQFSINAMPNQQTGSAGTGSSGNAGPTPGTAANPSNGGGGNPGSSASNSSNTVDPFYLTPESIDLSTLRNDAPLATVQGTIKGAADKNATLPAWMKLDSATGVISVADATQAKAGIFNVIITLTPAAGNEIIARATISITDTAHQGNDPADIPAGN